MAQAAAAEPGSPLLDALGSAAWLRWGSPPPSPPPNPATQAAYSTVPSLNPSPEAGPLPLSGFESVHPGGPPYSGHRYLGCQHGWKRGTGTVWALGAMPRATGCGLLTPKSWARPS